MVDDEGEISTEALVGAETRKSEVNVKVTHRKKMVEKIAENKENYNKGVMFTDSFILGLLLVSFIGTTITVMTLLFTDSILYAQIEYYLALVASWLLIGGELAITIAAIFITS